MPPSIRIGSRKSKLAVLQAEAVRSALLAAWPGLEAARLEIVTITTSGDRHTSGSLADIGGKGLFSKELQEALLEGKIDLAVHSMKDMETALPEGLGVYAVLEREDAREALVSRAGRGLSALPRGARIGTCSVRRAAQLLRMRPDLRIAPLRGNVTTRLEKLASGAADATVLALAGLKRLRLAGEADEVFAPETMIPAVAQGAIGVECRSGDTALREKLERINHLPSWQAVTAERTMLRVLDGSCRTPIAGYAALAGGALTLTGEVLAPDGSACRRAALSGNPDDAESIGEEVGRRLLGE